MLRAVIAIIALLPAAALADGYFGAQYGRGSYTEDGIDATANPGVGVLRGGGFINENLSVEGRVGFGVADSTVAVGTVDATVSVDRTISGFIRGHAPLGDDGSLYGAIGYTDGKMEVSAPGYYASESDSGMSYGVGIETDFGGGGGIGLEWMSYLDGTKNGIGYEYSALSLGFYSTF